MGRATMKDVARAAGVSATTVSHVINSTRKVQEETRQRVLQSIRACNYHVNPVARNLRSGNSMVIGFVASNLANYFYMEVAKGINAVLHTSGYRLFFVDSCEDVSLERRNIETFLRDSLDGLIMVPAKNDCRYLDDIVPRDYPMVFIDRKPTGFRRDTILATNERGTYEAVRLLLEKGRRRIAFIASQNDDTTMRRFKGYILAHREAGVEPSADLIHRGVGEPLTLHGLKTGNVYRLMKRLVRHSRLDGIYSANNLAAVGAYSALREEGIVIPDQVAFVSFDDSFWFSMTTPAITAVVQSPQDFGERAAAMLLRRIAGDKSPYREEFVQTRLIIRQSC